MTQVYLPPWCSGRQTGHTGRGSFYHLAPFLPHSYIKHCHNTWFFSPCRSVTHSCSCMLSLSTFCQGIPLPAQRRDKPCDSANYAHVYAVCAWDSGAAGRCGGHDHCRALDHCSRLACYHCVTPHTATGMGHLNDAGHLPALFGCSNMFLHGIMGAEHHLLFLPSPHYTHFWVRSIYPPHCPTLRLFLLRPPFQPPTTTSDPLPSQAVPGAHCYTVYPPTVAGSVTRLSSPLCLGDAPTTIIAKGTAW